VRIIAFISGDAPEMERMEIDEDSGALNKGKLRLPFHHEEEDGSVTDMRGHLVSVTRAEPVCQPNKED